jgi:hypothetical protein
MRRAAEVTPMAMAVAISLIFTRDFLRFICHDDVVAMRKIWR